MHDVYIARWDLRTRPSHDRESPENRLVREGGLTPRQYIELEDAFGNMVEAILDNRN